MEFPSTIVLSGPIHRPLVLTSRLDLDHVVSARFALAGGTDADEARLVAQLGEIGCAEIAHAGLNAADELCQHTINRSGRFAQGFHAFGSDLGGDFLVVSVT